MRRIDKDKELKKLLQNAPKPRILKEGAMPIKPIKTK